MRTIWTIIAVIAVANLLAFGAVAGWLWGTERVSVERLRAVRDVLSETIPQQAAREKSQAAKEKAAQAAAAEEEKKQRPPLTAAEQLLVRLQSEEMQMQRAKEVTAQLDMLKDALRSEQAKLVKARKEFEDERQAFETRRAQIAELEGSTQFKKAMGVLEGLEPKAARSVLQEMLTAQTAPGELDGKTRVVTYLSLMKNDKRQEVMAEFAKGDPALAADLLERIRTHGGAAKGSETSGP